MKKMLFLFGAVLVLFLAGCSKTGENEAKSSQSSPESTVESITISTPKSDKHTQYLKNYVGRNASDTGTERMSGQFMDTYGDANIPLVFITESGEAVTADNIKDYVVESQEPEAGTQIDLTFETSNSGDEYNFPESVSLDEIVLHVKKVDFDN